MSKVLEQKLGRQARRRKPAERDKIVRLVNEAINKTRELARGLLPVVSDARRADVGARSIGRARSRICFSISCRFECDDPVLIRDVDAATHLYHIAQEAVNNAIKHGDAATRSSIVARREDGRACSTVEDDGVGIAEPCRRTAPGMGLHIMSYRANMIGGTLDVRRGDRGGTVVSCLFPLQSARRVE